MRRSASGVLLSLFSATISAAQPALPQAAVRGLPEIVRVGAGRDAVTVSAIVPDVDALPIALNPAPSQAEIAPRAPEETDFAPLRPRLGIAGSDSKPGSEPSAQPETEGGRTLPADIRRRVLAIFEENRSDRSNYDVYTYGDCAANVKRLFDKMNSSVTTLKRGDFQALVVAHPLDRNPFTGVSIANARVIARRKVSFHAAMVFQGLVLDLDNAASEAQTVSEYVRTFFPHGRLFIRELNRHDPVSKDLAAYVIPGDYFFRLNGEELGQRDTVKKLIRTHRASSVPLLQWANLDEREFRDASQTWENY